MKLKNIILSLFVLCVALPSCYEDLGNYTYKEINEVEISGIEAEYARDLDDYLEITPDYKGTLYSDTTKFDFKWTVDGRVKSEYASLKVLVDFATGKRSGRVTITDKETGVKTFKSFYVNVSSSTAGDLYMILSKSKGKAELSYLRLDKPSNFAINYYEERTGKVLGVNPQQLCMTDINSANANIYPFSKGYGRVMVLVDNTAYLFDKHTLALDTITTNLSGTTYTGLVSYPPADVEGYKSEYLYSIVEMWRQLNNGSQQEGTQFAEISGGKYYGLSFQGNAPNSAKRYFDVEGGSDEAYLSPFCFHDNVSDAPADYPWVQGNTLGNLMVFDETSGRFAFVYYGGCYLVDDLKVFSGAKLLWGSDTNSETTCMAVLNEGVGTRMVLLNKSGSGSSADYTIGGEVITSSVINSSTRFYAMKYSSYLFFVTGDKLYSYNILDAVTGVAPSERNVVARLSDYGYDNNAVIKAICVSRSERTMLLGVSRYGNDTEAMDEENKGDLVVLDLNASTLAVSKKEIHKGVSGIPVDVKVKYQIHYRNGKNKDGSYRDNI